MTLDLFCRTLTALLVDSAIKATLLLALVTLVAWLLSRCRPAWQGAVVGLCPDRPAPPPHRLGPAPGAAGPHPPLSGAVGILDFDCAPCASGRTLLR